jgi:hypothetical protein
MENDQELNVMDNRIQELDRILNAILRHNTNIESFHGLSIADGCVKYVLPSWKSIITNGLSKGACLSDLTESCFVFI